MPKDVHPQIQVLLDRAAEAGLPKIHTLTPAEARAQFDANVARMAQIVPGIEVEEVVTTSTGAGYGHVPVRLYKHQVQAAGPAIVYYHGGGHVLGGLESHDLVARSLAQRTGFAVIAVDYRMGPEHPFPAAVEDSFDALRWVQDTAATLDFDPARVAVAGDSAGGNLATIVALMARDRTGPTVAAQMLGYPVIDYRGGTESYPRYGSGYGVLETETVDWFMQHYLPNASDRDDWRATPIKANLAGLPPTMVLLAECDVLVAEGRAYAKAMAAEGVPVETQEYAGMVHGFFSYVGLVDTTADAYADAANFLKRVLSF